MQDARHALRDGGCRHRLPRPGDAGGLRRALPGVRPRLLCVLRSHGDAEYDGLAAWWRDELGVEPIDISALRTYNAGSESFRKESEAYEYADH